MCACHLLCSVFILSHNYSNLTYLGTKPLQFSINFVYGFGYHSAGPLRPQVRSSTFHVKRVCFGHVHMLGPSKSFANIHGTTFCMICPVTMAAVLYLISPCINAGTVLLAVSHFCFWKKNENANQNQIFFPFVSAILDTSPTTPQQDSHACAYTPHTHKSGMLF